MLERGDILRLIALESGRKKDGGSWYKATFRKRSSSGKLAVETFWLLADVGARMIQLDLIEDVDVCVTLGFNEYLKPEITAVEPVGDTTFDLGGTS